LVVIINADDLGISSQVNREVFRLAAEGAITSTTILANGEAMEQAAAEARNFPQVSFGVHLNLTEFQPVEPSTALRLIVDKSGRFRGNRVRELRINRELKAAIFHEWCAQIEKLVALGITPSHLDSHHHTHTIPELFPVLRSVGRKYGIKKVRISRNVFTATDPLMLRMKKSAYNAALRYLAGFRTTDLFSGLDMFLQAGNGSLRGGKSIELMVHPGAPGSENESSQLVEWVRRQSDIRLVSYNDF